jgi:ABC-type amino acid transport system permease subunit
MMPCVTLALTDRAVGIPSQIQHLFVRLHSLVAIASMMRGIVGSGILCSEHAAEVCQLGVRSVHARGIRQAAESISMASDMGEA